MNDAQWADAWKLYLSGGSLPPDQLQSFLQEANPDPEVRDAVLTLLDRSSQPGALDPIGQKIGRYILTGRLGAGGMGEVFAARDAELGRTVAVKLINAHAHAAPPLERFIHEAKAASALNHPNIVTVHEVIQTSARLAIVMEWVDGSPLRNLCGAPLPVDRVIHLGLQAAQALAAAHARGIVHCDIKPENLMVRNDGIVKVLDFGLARDLSDAASRSALPAGTLQYLSPERSQGEPPSPATDIFALGIVLYELATGAHPFAAASLFETLKKLDAAAPPPPSHANSYVPPHLDALILRMLARDPAQRPAAALVVSQLEARSPSPLPPPAARAPFSWRLPAVLTTLALLVAAVAYLWAPRAAPDLAAVRFSFSPPFRARALHLAVSPDASRIAFTNSNSTTGIWLRAANSLTAERLPGTDFAISPFWSPDSQSLAFISHGGGLRRIDLTPAGPRPPQTLARVASNYAGGAWSPRGVILYAPHPTGAGLYRVPARGGTPEPATRLNPAHQEIAHRYPEFLPDGKHFIYWVWSGVEEYTGIYLGSLDPSEKLPATPLVRTWREAHFAAPGHLLYLDGPTLVSRPFDPAGLRFTGDPVRLSEPVARHRESTGRAQFSVAGGRALVYQEALPGVPSRLVIRDRAGNPVRSVDGPVMGHFAALNPRETTLALQGVDDNTVEALWSLDLSRGIVSRLTASTASNQRPIWSPDGKNIAFYSNRAGAYDIYSRPTESAGGDELLVRSPYAKTAEAYSPDGKFLLFTETHPDTKADIWYVPLAGDRKPLPYIKSGFDELWPKFSRVPDAQGRQWFVYMSDRTGTLEVYLRPFLPGRPEESAAAEVRVSSHTGAYPCWRNDGREVYFFEGAKDPDVIAVDVQLTVPPRLGAPRRLFKFNNESWGGCAVFANGQRFAFMEPPSDFTPAKINVVLNWTAGLR